MSIMCLAAVALLLALELPALRRELWAGPTPWEALKRWYG